MTVIDLDQGPGQTSRPPVIAPRNVGAVVVGAVVDMERRPRLDREGAPIMNSRGKPASEEILTILTLDGTTGTVTADDDEWTPPAGTVCRLIFAGIKWGRLIDARKLGAEGRTRVGDIVTVTTPTATIWRGKGDIAARDVDDVDKIARARAKGLSVGFDWKVDYRRASADEAAIVAQAVAAHQAQKAAAAPDLDDAF